MNVFVKGFVLHPGDVPFPEFFSLPIRFHCASSLISPPTAGNQRIPG